MFSVKSFLRSLFMLGPTVFCSATAFPPEFLLEKLDTKAIIFKMHGIFEEVLEKIRAVIHPMEYDEFF